MKYYTECPVCGKSYIERHVALQGEDGETIQFNDIYYGANPVCVVVHPGWVAIYGHGEQL